MNNFTVELYNEQTRQWIDYTSHAVFPLKKAGLLDEQLDEAQLTLKWVKEQYFNPQTLVRITFNNTPEAKYLNASKVINRAENDKVSIVFNNSTKKITETLTETFVIASDNAIETPNGSGKYNHEIYLIETTKILEGFICDSITFTNVLGNNFENS